MGKGVGVGERGWGIAESRVLEFNEKSFGAWKRNSLYAMLRKSGKVARESGAGERCVMVYMFPCIVNLKP